MKQVRHVLITRDEPMDQEQMSKAMTHLFEWANKAGRSGRMVTSLDIQPMSCACVEYVTDDDYQRMLANGEITEKKDEPLECEIKPDDDLAMKPGSKNEEKDGSGEGAGIATPEGDKKELSEEVPKEYLVPCSK